MMVDFTFKNKLIADFFSGSDEYIPTGELIYIEEHPLIRSHFVNEIADKIDKAAEVVNRKHITGKVIDELNNLNGELAKKMMELSRLEARSEKEEVAKQMLLTLRKINNLVDYLLTEIH
jgi:hypothetical protein